MLVDSTGLKVFGEGEWNCGFMELLNAEHGKTCIWRPILKSGYPQRSKVETAMFRYKATFGGNLKARNFENQETEVLIGCKILNAFFQI